MQKQENPIYLKAITIRDVSDVLSIKEDIKKGMILILRVMLYRKFPPTPM